ncbi:unnamed protein product [Brachionus calyciflorus]|uniref:Uncharacterized protein n=1 Tax=Brachionus calyciflorus TaxID=104777 RepID=A0A814H8D2_9BILA|nr:unnamed protein product [Brachionus calyciflorus]
MLVLQNNTVSTTYQKDSNNQLKKFIVNSEYKQAESMNVYKMVLTDETRFTQDKEENNSNKILPNNEKERPKYSFDYLANVITVEETIKNFIKGQKLTGYIQSVAMYQDLKINLNMEKQFEAINKTPLKNTVLHFDATESLESILQKYTKNLFDEG